MMNLFSDIQHAIDERVKNSIILKEIYEIFKEFYGEEALDLQTCSAEYYMDQIKDSNIYQDLIKDASFLNTLNFKNVSVGYCQKLIEAITNTDSSIKEECYNILLKYIDAEPFPYSYILVHFPKVTVTNEFGNSINIKDLYMKVALYSLGQFHSLSGTRTTFTPSQYTTRYIHSHIQRLEYNNLGEFRKCCLGTGPIKDITQAMKIEYDTNRWRLFCFELSRYVTIESLSGGPYIKLSSVVGYDKLHPIDGDILYSEKNYDKLPEHSKMLNDFFIQLPNIDILKFNYNNTYRFALNNFELLVFISNAFITWYNQSSYRFMPNCTLKDMLKLDFLLQVTIENDTLYKLWGKESLIIEEEFSEATLFYFKGKEIKLNLIDEDCIESKLKYLLLNPKYISPYVTKLINIINYGYNNPRIKNFSNTKIRCF
jgi:hypothetical protein